MRYIFIAATALAAAMPAVAQTTVTPTNLQGWQLADGKGNGDAATITSAQPRSGNGSLQFAITTGAQQPLAAYLLSRATQLSTLTTIGGSFGFDYLADANQVVAPTYRLLIGGMANTGGSQYGSFGWFGETGAGWQTANLNADVGDFFLRVSGKGQLDNSCGNTSYSQSFGANQRQTLDNWIGVTCSGGTTVDLSNAYVYGIEVDYGSFPGLVNPTTVYADNVSFSLTGYDQQGFYNERGDFNFETDEVDPTPEPATLSLVGLGLVGVGAVRRRRRAVK